MWYTFTRVPVSEYQGAQSDPDVHAGKTPTMQAQLQEAFWDIKAPCEGVAELQTSPHKEASGQMRLDPGNVDCMGNRFWQTTIAKLVCKAHYLHT